MGGEIPTGCLGWAFVLLYRGGLEPIPVVTRKQPLYIRAQIVVE
jgi:hypothetical protein